MANSPFFKVIFEDDSFDLTEHISSFKSIRSTEEDNTVDIFMRNAPIDLINDINQRKEQTIKFKFGLLGGDQSAERVAKLRSIRPQYGKTASLKLLFKDLGLAIKKHKSNRIYTQQTASEIVEFIANRYGLEKDIESTTLKYDFPQGNKTYYQAIKSLAKKEGFQFFISDNKLVFKKRSLKKEASRLYTYNRPDGKILSFKPKYQDEGNASKTASNGVDTDSGEMFAVESSAESTNEAGVGSTFLQWDVDGNLLDAVSEVGDFVQLPDINQATHKKQVDKSTDDAILNNLVADLELELDPTVEIDDIITVAGVDSDNSGNWYVWKITDNIKGGISTTYLEMKRNATNAQNSGQGKPSDINNTTGNNDDSQTKEIEIVSYDVDGNEIK